MKVNSKEANKILDAAGMVCFNCVEDTLNNEDICDNCPVRKMCLSLDYEEEKLKYTKENVLHYLNGIENEYNKKYIKACNDIKISAAAKEKARQYGDMKHAIQLLIVDFEKDFE